jgi:hypothetical protein
MAGAGMKGASGMISKSRLFIALSALAVVALQPVRAEYDKSAYDKYVAGDYDGAVAKALSIGGAENLTLAARALNSLAYLGKERKANREAANRALDHAEDAVRLNPSLLQARLEAAIALSLRAANMAPARALALNLPGRARKQLDAALGLDPENLWALSTSASWRLGVSSRGGGALFGADPEIGYSEFMKARAVAPENVVVAYECALRFIASERAEWRELGLEALAVATDGAPESAFEAGIQDRARDLAAAIKAGPKSEAAFIAEQP